MKRKSGKDFCGFALPGLFCFVAVVIVPFIYGVYLTLTDWNGVSDVKNFVGFTNFISVFKDTQFWTSLLLTFKYVIFVVIIVNVLAFAIAYLLTRGIKAQNFFRAGFFTPNLIGGLVLGYIWQFVFSRVFVGIGDATGWSLFESSWLSDPSLAFAALVLVSVLQLSGYMILIYVAMTTRVRVKPMPMPMPSRADSPTECLLANISARPRMMQLTTIRGRYTPRASYRSWK